MTLETRALRGGSNAAGASRFGGRHPLYPRWLVHCRLAVAPLAITVTTLTALLWVFLPLTTALVCVAAAVTGYAFTAISDHMIHRFVWHGRWAVVFRWSRWLETHYVHHVLAHHQHARDASRTLFREGRVPGHLKATLEDDYAHDPWTQRALRCSNHGLSITSGLCALNYYSLFLLTPHPYVCLALLALAGPLPALFFFAPSLLTIFTQISHRYYHMTTLARRRLAPRGLRWFFCTPAFDALAREHQMHHYGERHADDFYTVVPFGPVVLYPLFGRW